MMSDLYCPFYTDENIHPAADDVQTQSLVWAESFGLLSSEQTRQRYEAALIGHGLALAHPTGSAVGLQLIVDWFTHFDLWDDAVEESWDVLETAITTDSYVRMFQTGERHGKGGPVLDAAWDLQVRLAAITSRPWLQHFAGLLRKLGESFVWECLHVSHSLPISAEGYLQVGEWVIGGQCWWELMSLLTLPVVDDRMHMDPLVISLKRTGSRLLFLQNSLYGFRGDMARSNPFNLVTLTGLPLGESIRQTIDRHNIEMRHFESLLQQASGHANPAIVALGMAIGRCFAAHLEWAGASGRSDGWMKSPGV